MANMTDVSSAMTEATREKLKEGIQILNDAVAKGKGELRIINAGSAPLLPVRR
jgi:hypothetical protein